MANNQTVADLRVKQIRVEKLVSGAWVRPPESYFAPGDSYRVLVTFGNTGGMIQYADEQYRKDVVNIRIIGEGFLVGSRHYDKGKMVFYTDGSYSTPVTGDPTRKHFNLGVPFETFYADTIFIAHFKVLPGISQRGITSWHWNTGIYASVRDRVWRRMLTAV